LLGKLSGIYIPRPLSRAAFIPLPNDITVH
jgi:hypothetical protein